MEKIKLIIADDHKDYRDVLKILIQRMDNIELIGEASDGIEFLEILKNESADVGLLDIQMPNLNGIETAKQALNNFPGLKIIALTMFGEFEYLKSMLSAGCKGFLVKEEDNFPAVLHDAIMQVEQGKYYFSTSLDESTNDL